MRRPLAHPCWSIPLAVMVLTTPTDAQQVCDPDLRPVAGDLGYQLRDGRCEGLYVSEISASALEVVSVTPPDAATDVPPVGDAVAIRVLGTPDPEAPIHLLATGRHTRTYYQMNAGLVGGALAFLWNVGVLTEASLTIENVGILAYTEDARGRRTYYATVVASPDDDEEPTAPEDPVVVSVRTNVDTESVVYRCLKEGEPGACTCERAACRLGDWIIHELPGDQVPAGEVIRLLVNAQRPVDVDIAVMPRDSAAYRAPLTVPVGPP